VLRYKLRAFYAALCVDNQGAHGVVAKDGDAMAKSEAEAREIANRLMQEIDFRANEARARGERFEQLDEPTLMRKLMGEAAHSPFFTSLSWSDGPPGGTITFTAFIHNPDPTSYSGFALFGYLLFGPANFVQSTDDALVSEDTRFPRYWKSLGVAIGGNANAAFTVNIPTGITPGVYIGNCFLVLRNSFDVGEVFDRASFDMTVT